MYLEKGHCHVSVPKLEVLLDMNNWQGTKQDLRSLLSSIGRRNRKARSHHSLTDHTARSIDSGPRPCRALVETEVLDTCQLLATNTHAA